MLAPHRANRCSIGFAFGVLLLRCHGALDRTQVCTDTMHNSEQCAAGDKADTQSMLQLGNSLTRATVQDHVTAKQTSRMWNESGLHPQSQDAVDHVFLDQYGTLQQILLDPEELVGALPEGVLWPHDDERPFKLALDFPSLVRLPKALQDAAGGGATFALGFGLMNHTNPTVTWFNGGKLPASCLPITTHLAPSSGARAPALLPLSKQCINLEGPEHCFKYFAGIALLDGSLRPTGRSVIWESPELAELLGHANFGEFTLMPDPAAEGKFLWKAQEFCADMSLEGTPRSFVHQLELRIPVEQGELTSAMSGAPHFAEPVSHVRGQGLLLDVTSPWATLGQGKNQHVIEDIAGSDASFLVEVWPYNPRELWRVSTLPLAAEETPSPQTALSKLPVVEVLQDNRSSLLVPIEKNSAHGGSCCVSLPAMGQFPEMLLGIARYHNPQRLADYRSFLYATSASHPEQLVAVSKPFCHRHDQQAEACPEVQVFTGLSRIAPDAASNQEAKLVLLYAENYCMSGILELPEASLLTLLQPLETTDESKENKSKQEESKEKQQMTSKETHDMLKDVHKEIMAMHREMRAFTANPD
eukprot:gnl/TRDRNA2_/TRDRNA2_173874_c0_seq4.p1 gnl/TRDRNA2_/TRDRNA2_173874_c0~~gnl/TRDRNA2_/TRDRNA2_173874_c0_seq4.p1  ORF type:complete len:586 (-),score=79.16 gnl/TRDRNA2_/TRDRNA2_173874_c0_seq4:257-2014(-)